MSKTPTPAPFAFGRGAQFINEQERQPALRTPVIVCVMRRAQLVPDGAGGHKWELLNPHEPIDLDLDTVYWLPPAA